MNWLLWMMAESDRVRVIALGLAAPLACGCEGETRGTGGIGW